jgi:hypothetical protein
MMQDPAYRDLLGNLVESEADEGSDNEENDDVIKNIDRAAEMREAGLEGLDLDQDL